jgi:hypothetical protein
MSIGVTEDYKLKVKNLHASHRVGLGTGTPEDRPYFFFLPVIETEGLRPGGRVDRWRLW